jgi:hypothetical protein
MPIVKAAIAENLSMIVFFDGIIWRWLARGSRNIRPISIGGFARNVMTIGVN